MGIFPAANAGVRGSAAPVIFLMDDDVELVDEGTLASVCDAFESGPRLGVLGVSEFYPGGRHRGESAPDRKTGMAGWRRDTRLEPAGMGNRMMPGITSPVGVLVAPLPGTPSTPSTMVVTGITVSVVGRWV